MINLKSLITEGKKISSILGYVDAYDHIKDKVVYEGDPMDNHQALWPGKISAHGKWRWSASSPKHLNLYGESMDEETKDRIWRLIDQYLAMDKRGEMDENDNTQGEFIADQIYQDKHTMDYFNVVTSKYPGYNNNPQQTKSALKDVLNKIQTDPYYKKWSLNRDILKRLASKFHSGMT